MLLLQCAVYLFSLFLINNIFDFNNQSAGGASKSNLLVTLEECRIDHELVVESSVNRMYLLNLHLEITTIYLSIYISTYLPIYLMIIIT